MQVFWANLPTAGVSGLVFWLAVERVEPGSGVSWTLIAIASILFLSGLYNSGKGG